MNGVETCLNFVTLNGNAIIKKYPKSKIIIESGVIFVSNTINNVAGINHPVVLATLSENAVISIGKDSGLSGVTICTITSVSIGSYVGLGVNVCIYDTDFQTIDPFERRC